MPRPRISEDLRDRVMDMAGTDPDSFEEALTELVEGVEAIRERQRQVLAAQRQQQAQQPRSQEQIEREIRQQFG